VSRKNAAGKAGVLAGFHFRLVEFEQRRVISESARSQADKRLGDNLRPATVRSFAAPAYIDSLGTGL
jgi:hypothetical protein